MPPGCLALLVLVFLLVLVPLFFAQLMLTAVSRLGLPPHLALLALVGIFLGGAVNIPVTRRRWLGPLDGHQQSCGR